MRFTDREVRLLFQLYAGRSLFDWLSDEMEVDNYFLDTLYHTTKLTYSRQELLDVRRCGKWLLNHYSSSPNARKMIQFRIECYEYAWDQQHPNDMSTDEAMVVRELTINGKAHLVDITLEMMRREKKRINAI